MHSLYFKNFLATAAMVIWSFLLLALAFFGVALLAHALSLLVRRAAALQRDSDLTI